MIYDDGPPSSFWDDYDKEEKTKNEAISKQYQPYSPLVGVPQKVSKCTHKGNVKVFETKHLVVYGGGVSRGVQPITEGVNIDLSGYLIDDDFEIRGIRCSRLMKYSYPIIKIDWKDGSIVGWDRDQWKALIDDLNDEAKRRNKKLSVLVTCLGGHGRTGTALTIMAWLCHAVPKGKDPIGWIRDIYCQEAVETVIQEKYTDLLTIHYNEKGE